MSRETETSTESKPGTTTEKKSKCCKCWVIIKENKKVQSTKNVLKYIIKPLIVILLYYADIITDIYLAVSYLRDQHYFWFSLTTFFIIVPWIAGFLIYYNSIINGGEGGINVETRWGQRLCSAIAPVYAQMKIYITYKTLEEEEDDPGFDNYNMEEESKLDETLVQIIESFTESAPQLLLQMYITLKAIQDPTLQNEGLERNISMGVALIKMAFSLTARETARINWLRSKAVQTQLTKKFRDNKEVMLKLKIEGKKQYNEFPYLAIFMHMTMRTVEIGQRIIALGFIAATPKFFLPAMIAMAVHWLVTFVWELVAYIMNNRKQKRTDNVRAKDDKDADMDIVPVGDDVAEKKKSTFDETKERDGIEIISNFYEEEAQEKGPIKRTAAKEGGDIGFASEGDDEDEQAMWITIILMVVKASMLLFCHENQTKHRDTLRMVLFYTIFFVENTVAIALWLQYTPLIGMWFYESVFYFFLLAPIVHVALHISIEKLFMKEKDMTKETAKGVKGTKHVDKAPSLTLENEQNEEPDETYELLQTKNSN